MPECVAAIWQQYDGNGRLNSVRRDTIPRPPVYLITAVQLVSALVISGMIYAIRGSVDSSSVLLGSLIQITGTAYFAFRAFRYQGASRANAVVRQMYQGASGKIVLSAVLFALIFAFVRPINGLFVLAGYVLMQGLQIAMAALVTRR